MGRKRKSGEKLPKYVYRHGNWYIWRADKIGVGPPVKLVRTDAPVSAVWAAWEDLQRPERETLEGLMAEYIQASQLAPRTEKDYRAYARLLAGAALADGRTLGQIRPDELTRQFVILYLDKHVATPTAVNRRVQFLKAVYSWALNRCRVEENPCTGAKLHRTAARDRYVNDREYTAVLELAQEWAAAGRYPYLWIMMELAYLLRARRSEVERLQRSQIQGDILDWQRAKGSRGEYTRISPRLRTAIEAGKRLEADIASRYIVHRRGQRITKNAFDSAWQRLMDEAERRGLVAERFTFHDLKAKGVSDHEQHYSGHKSERQRGDYIRKPDEVEATR
jgi:hypothetical protein